MQRYYSDYYGRSLAIIGHADSGVMMEPHFADSKEKVFQEFEGGVLVDSAVEAIDAGAEYIYLIRINSQNKKEMFYDLNKVYTMLESMGDIDIILPAEVSLSDNIVDYPDIFRKVDTFRFNGSTTFETKSLIESINVVKVNGEKTKHYALRDSIDGYFDAVIFEKDVYDIDSGDEIFIDYNSIKNVSLDFEILAFKDSRLFNSFTLSAVVDVNKKVNRITDKKASEFFSPEEDLRYIARTKNKVFNVYTDSSGDGFVFAEFDYQKYIQNNTNYRYFAKNLAVLCSKTDAVGVLKSSSKDYSEMTKNILDVKSVLNENEAVDYGRYIAPVASNCVYGTGSGIYTSSYSAGFAGKMASLPTRKSLSHSANKSVVSIKDGFDNTEVKGLSENGYNTLYDSVRSGIVVYKAVTLGEGSFKMLKNIRVVNELSTRVKEITDSFIGKSTPNIDEKLYSLLDNLLSKMVAENKIANYEFEISELYQTFIEIKLDIQLYNELERIMTGVVSGV